MQVIFSRSERGYWSNENGWTHSLEDATRFQDDELIFFPASRGMDAALVSEDDAMDLIANPIHIGDEVYWDDPAEGISSGMYLVKDINTENKIAQSPDDILILGNEAGTVAEVFSSEVR